MITDVGKGILAKYLIGQAQSYASYIAIGVGARPVTTGLPFPDFASQTDLEFEVLRVPITSRGYVYDELGNPSVVFAAEIPSDERYEISEVGIYPARSNPNAGELDSKIVYNFSTAENWEYHTENASSAIETIVAPLNLDQPSGSIAVTNVVFRTNSNNTLFAGPIRLSLQERPRFLNRTLMLRGDMSYLIKDPVSLELDFFDGSPTYPASHVHYNGISLNLDSASPDDELRLAFSVLSKNENQSEQVQTVNLLLEFAEADVASPTNFARLEINLEEADQDINFTNNRYFVIKKKISELIKSPGFTWSAVNSVRIYSSVYQIGSAVPSDNFYISLDGLRFENRTSPNPLYGLTGYTSLKTDNGYPVVKEANTANIIEFRFGMDVV